MRYVGPEHRGRRLVCGIVAGALAAACVASAGSGAAVRGTEDALVCPSAVDPLLRGRGTYYLEPRDVVLLLGDAITVDAGYWRFVSQDLGTKFPQLAIEDDAAPTRRGDGVRVVNAGEAGDTACG